MYTGLGYAVTATMEDDRFVNILKKINQRFDPKNEPYVPGAHWCGGRRSEGLHPLAGGEDIVGDQDEGEPVPEVSQVPANGDLQYLSS